MRDEIKRRMPIKIIHHRNRLRYLFFLPTLLFFLTNCVEIGKVFDGNTRHKFGDYDIDERQEYKRYLDNKSLKSHEKDREIMRRLRDDEKDSSPADQEDEDRPWLSRMLRRIFRAE